MSKPTDVRPIGAKLYLLPVETRVPLKFGAETLTHVLCARVCVRVRDAQGNTADGWGETPLSVPWAWPCELSFDERQEAMNEFSAMLASAWAGFGESGHPLEIGVAFNEKVLPGLLEELNGKREDSEPMPWLAALICCSAFDLAVHDAYGKLHGVSIYETYNANYMNQDLSSFLEPAEGASVDFAGKYPADFFVDDVPTKLPAWHLVGGGEHWSAVMGCSLPRQEEMSSSLACRPPAPRSGRLNQRGVWVS